MSIKYYIIIIGALFLSPLASAQEKAGNCSKFDPDCIHNPYGAGSPYKQNGINNPYSNRGSRYSSESANNPYATNAPKLYDQDGKYRSRLSSNPYATDSTSIHLVVMEVPIQRIASIILVVREIPIIRFI